MGMSGSPRGGSNWSPDAINVADGGLLDRLGYWGLPAIFGGIYIVIIALRVTIPRLRSSSMDRAAREIREKRGARCAGPSLLAVIPVSDK